MRLISILVLICLAFLTGCEPHPRRHAHRHHATQPVKVKHLHDGRVVYQDSSGDFWFYMYLMSSSNSSTPAYVSGTRSFNYYSTPSVRSLPSGGSWVRASQVPGQDEKEMEAELNEAETVETTTEVDADGSLVEASEMSESVSGDDSYNGGDSTAGDADSSDSSGSDSGSSDSGSSDSGSSDSGGGGDSGGGDSGGGSSD